MKILGKLFLKFSLNAYDFVVVGEERLISNETVKVIVTREQRHIQ